MESSIKDKVDVQQKSDTEKVLDETSFILEGDIKQVILKLSFPIFIGMFVQLAYNITDSIWISRIDLNDASYIGSVGLVFPIFFIAIAFANGLVTGVSAIVARSIGAKKETSFAKVFIHASWLAFFLSVLFLIFSVVYAEDTLVFLGAKDDYLNHSLDYFYYLIPSIILLFVGSVFVSIMQGKGIMKPVMYAMLIATVCNIILDPIFIFTLDLKIKGAAIATTISQSLAVIFIIIKYSNLKLGFKQKKSIFSLDTSIFKEIVSIGFSQSFGQILIAISFVIFNYFIIHMNENALSAFSLCGRLDQFVYLPIIAISTALVTIIGQNYGNGNYERIKLFWKKGVSMCLISVFVFATIMIVLAPYIYKQFSNIEEVVYYSVLQTQILEYSFLFSVVTVLAGSVFQAVNRPAPAILLALIRLIAIPLPIIVIMLLKDNLTIEGVWISIFASNIITAIISWFWINNMQKELKEALD